MVRNEQYRSKMIACANGANIQVVDRRAFKNAEPPKDWKGLRNTNWCYRIPTLEELMRATNHWNGVDPATPQAWFEEYMRTHKGERPRACWSYENNKMFGEPLWYDTMFTQLEEMLTEVWKQDGEKAS